MKDKNKKATGIVQFSVLFFIYTRIFELYKELVSYLQKVLEINSLPNNFPPRNFHKRMYLLGAATSYIILYPRKYQLVAALSLIMGSLL